MAEKALKNLSLVLIFVSIFIPFAFSQETLTITTYYPSPYGSYREIRSQRMAIGDAYYDGAQYCWPGGTCTNAIDANADLVIEGNAGIGTESPGRKLVVKGIPANSLHTAKFVADNDWGVALGGFKDAAGTDQTYGSIQSCDASGAAGNLILQDIAGNVGIGTTSPTAKLEVTGGVKIGNDVVACDASKAGTIRTITGATSTTLEYCDGNQWTSLVTGLPAPKVLGSFVLGSELGLTSTLEAIPGSGININLNIEGASLLKLEWGGPYKIWVNNRDTNLDGSPDLINEGIVLKLQRCPYSLAAGACTSAFVDIDRSGTLVDSRFIDIDGDGVINCGFGGVDSCPPSPPFVDPASLVTVTDFASEAMVTQGANVYRYRLVGKKTKAGGSTLVVGRLESGFYLTISKIQAL